VRDGSIAGLRHLAYFSPLPPERSGIADYSEELLPYLAKLVQLTLFASNPAQVAGELRDAFEVRPIADYNQAHQQYDIALYHMGNSLLHDALYRILLRYPGVTVIHDLGLHDFTIARTIAQGDFVSYVRELGYALGPKGVESAYQIRRGQPEPPLLKAPLNERVLDRSLGVIVHSHYAERWIRDARPNLSIAMVPAPIRTDLGPLSSRRELGCPEDTLLFASAGQVFPHKQVTSALEAFARLRADFPQARYVVIGDEIEQNGNLQAWLQERNLEEAVIRTGHQTDIRNFVSWIAAADILINLRHPTVGETSATALRGLAAGRPVIVSDHGWYAELPDDVCVKVTPNDDEALYQAMRRLAGDPDLRRAIGQRAAAYAQREHSLVAAAQRYLDFIRETVARTTGKLAQVTP
jgi:glycosyltransferase involved in cell wall biosynthesis